MEIVFASKKLEKLCVDGTIALRKLGVDQAARLRARLDDLHAAETLHVMRQLPGRCHELKGDMAGQLSVDLIHPQRLIFEPAHDPAPSKPDGGLDWESVRVVRVIAIKDTHE